MGIRLPRGNGDRLEFRSLLQEHADVDGEGHHAKQGECTERHEGQNLTLLTPKGARDASD